MSSAAQYKKHTHREHILELPDTYIGSVETALEPRWVYNRDRGCMEWRNVAHCPGFLKIFDEVLVNALDHRVRQAGRIAAGAKDALPVKHIDVTLTPERITVRNDGNGIPVEKHPDTGIWAPELIFGHLLTSSNYDKSEEKIVGGKNGYGQKCNWHKTPVLMWDGTVKTAAEVVVGDRLIGDDGTPRTVLSVLHGEGKLYTVHQGQADSYTVNDAHTLTLMMPDHKVIFWNTSKNGWTMLWWNHATKSIGAKTVHAGKPDSITCEECDEVLSGNIARHYSRRHPDAPVPKKSRLSPTKIPEMTPDILAARTELEEFAKTISDCNVFDMDIAEYMALNETTKKRLAGVRGKCVEWERREVSLDPYMLGLWLGDGMSHGYAMTCFGEKDPEIVSFLEEWSAKNDTVVTKTSKFVYGFKSASNPGKKGCAPLKNQLAKYGLVNNKHIPKEYLLNDRETRLKVLAGLIDTDGHATRGGTRVQIVQSIVHKTLAEQIVYLCRSLGFCTSVHLRDVAYTHNGEKRYSKAYTINISGDNLSDIPTRVARKKCANTISHATNRSTGFLRIEEAGVDKYVGIHIDGNERFLINDFTVTHNCTNIFSKEFTLETVDHINKKKYLQTWTRNMAHVSAPSVSTSSVKPYTQVTFAPDLSRFNWGGGAVPTVIPADMLDVLATRVVDAAACAGRDCRITLNGAPVASNTFQKYINLYVVGTGGGDSETASVASEDAPAAGGAGAAVAPPAGGSAGKRIAYEQAGERWEIGAILTRDLHGDAPPDERHISFVNGIATRRGGRHVEHVIKTVLTTFCEAAKKKAKLDVTPALLKDSVVWFINSTIVNPSFDTQTKETLTTPPSKFGSLPVISPKFMDQLMKIGLLSEAQALLDAKTARDAKRTDGKKKSTVRGIPKLEDALWAGTAKSADCTLILTEGDSAATTAISGLKVVGRERYGVFPLRGKILNVKDATAAKKTANTELTQLKQILGLETGKVYTDLKQLRYGRVMIMTDQDVDGSHIKGLLMNLFHSDWPSLLQLGFLCCLMTPLLKATRGAQTLCFYSESEYEAWRAAQGEAALRGWKTKYYKGLGTSTAAEAREYFASMNTVEYVWDPATETTIDLAFNKKRADDRKAWLSTYDRARHLAVAAGGAKVTLSRFVHDELIHFSNADNIRSLPHVMDGLKPSQRKILWSALKRNLTSEIRVAQLAGYVSETAAYHHGEQSLTGAIVGMAQNYVGSNNLNLLSPNGQFGTRLMGGQDAASPRYIHTHLMPITRTLFRKEDDAVLTYLDDDGLLVEPETYAPVVPMLLVNGALGIGTGFSSTVLSYNPADCVAALRGRLQGVHATLAGMTLQPWWFGFKGAVLPGADSKTWITKGVYEFVDDDTCIIRIKELPVGTWTKEYKGILDDILAAQDEAKKKAKDAPAGAEKPVVMLRGYEEAYNDVDVDFILEMDPEYYHEARAYPSEFETKFRLVNSHKTTNMVAFDVSGKIRRFDTVGEILETFYGARLALYGARKAHELARMDAELRELSARHMFVKAVVEGRLVVANAPDAELLEGLQGLGLPPLSEGEGLKGYEYLLRMRVDRLKASAVLDLERDLATLQAARDTLAATAPETLWLNDLETFSEAWAGYTAWRIEAYTSAAQEGGAAGGAGAKAVKRGGRGAGKSKK
jgi:DNA topoisomerase-2